MNWKQWFRSVLYPPVWLLVLLALLCAPALVLVFLRSWNEHPVAYMVYTLSAYTLTAVTMACVRALPARCRALRQRLYAHPFGNRYLTDVAFRTHVSLYRSLAVNLLYVAINLISGLRFRAAWFLILAGYYSFLSVMRFLLLRYVNHNPIGQQLISERKRARLCACLLLLLNLSLTAAVTMMLRHGRGFQYPGMLIYAMAAYTFYITIAAVCNIVKYRKYHSPVLSTAKAINLAAALVSMLSLETAMLTRFGAADAAFRRIMIAATGAGISAIVVAMSVYIIARSTREIRRSRHGTT